jgi:leucyl-tRNA synthetase
MSNSKPISEYNFKEIEKKWKEKWEADKIYQSNLDKAKKPFYNLMMFPYPSAEGLHIGGVYTFTGVDTFGRYKKMQGYDVFEPIGLDGFGIHSENYAMKIGEHIKEVSKRTEKNFYRQLSSIGNMYDWSRTVETYKPEYYKWTQWLFLQLFKKGLAYQKKAKVNWCPWCKTVLSDEQVIQGACERCDSQVEKKELKQWFFKITDYAERLLKNLEWIDWSEDVKTNQKNWIGKSEGAEVQFKIQNSKFKINVFTTRPDTLFGATYMVLAPEHQLIEKIKDQIENWEEVERYINQAKAKSEQERKEDEKEKTGVEIKGVKAINPVNNKEIPIWIADYVLAGYGTGAIMAVPAHDERDWEFAKKYNIQVNQVVAPFFKAKKKSDLVCQEDKKEVKREVVYGFVRDPEENKIMMIDWNDFIGKSCICGGIKKGENILEAAKREIEEETGYCDLKFIKKSQFEIHANFFAPHKDENRYAVVNWVFFDLKSHKRNNLKKDDIGKHSIFWIDESNVEKEIKYSNVKFAWQMIRDGEKPFTAEGISINSDFLNDLKTEEAKKKMIKWLEEKGVGEKSVDYKLRDWCVSRQRYWGPPIPIIHCKNCGVVPVPEKDLPVELPEMEDFLPEGKGKGPLAKNQEFVKTKCPKCGGEAERETDVSDPFVDSAWYFLRYPSTEFENEAINKERTKKWLPVDSYIGGKEHTVLHLLYSRFITMVLKDLGYLDFEEPYKRFFGHGLITKDGAKMSKSKGNVINPDEMIEKYGVDTVRLYLRFLGDFSQGGDWRDDGADGMSRFVKKVWQTFHELEGVGQGVEKTQIIDKTVKVIGEDLEKLSFNTAVARYMEFINWVRENSDKFNQEQVEKVKKTMALVLAPLAPHIAEEFWAEMGNEKSIFTEKWPEFDENNLEDDQFELVIQVNGKVRDRMKVSRQITQEEAEKKALESDKITKHLNNQKPKKIIYIKEKLINIVI